MKGLSCPVKYSNFPGTWILYTGSIDNTFEINWYQILKDLEYQNKYFIYYLGIKENSLKDFEPDWLESVALRKLN